MVNKLFVRQNEDTEANHINATLGIIRLKSISRWCRCISGFQSVCHANVCRSVANCFSCHHSISHMQLSSLCSLISHALHIWRQCFFGRKCNDVAVMGIIRMVYTNVFMYVLCVTQCARLKWNLIYPHTHTKYTNENRLHMSYNYLSKWRNYIGTVEHCG